MRTTTPFLLATLLLSACARGPGQPEVGADLAIVGATVVDPATGRVLPDHTVTVRAGRIAAVTPTRLTGTEAGSDAAAAGAARVVDGRGRWLVPGLWDAHVHFRGGEELAEANARLLPLYLANGVTSVRDAGGDITAHLLRWRERIAAGTLPGPRIYTSGPKLDGPTGGWDGSIRLADPAGVPAALDSLQRLGADYVKIYDGSIGPEVYLAIVAEAERRGMPVTGHMPFSVTFADAVRAGLDATEHLYYAFKGAAANEDSVTAAVRAGELGFWDALAVLREGWSEARADSLYALMAARGTGVVPTLHIDDVLGHVADTDHGADPELAYIDPGIEATYAGRVRSAQRSSAAARQERIDRHADFLAMVGAMHAAGVPLYAGSDAGASNSYVYPGFSLHEELEDLVEAGLTPMAALEAATSAPAALLGVAERTGRIRPGADADLLLLDADPLADIANTRRIALVAQANGRVWTAGELAGLLASVRRPWAAGAQEAVEPLPPSIRPEANGLHGAVVSEHPLATEAGYAVLRGGGNAVDAAVTMAAVLAVVRPHMNGVGGDAFALFYDPETRAVTALNGSGRAAAGATPALFAERGIRRMPGSGALTVTVPGAVSAWAAALERHGTISLAEALRPAIEIAENGFVVSATLAADLAGADRLNPGGQAIYRPGDRALQPGDVLKSPALAATLRTLAAEGPAALYGGSVGAALSRFLQGEGSPLTLRDFAAHESTWTEPASVAFRGHRVHTMPPNSQGMVLLQMLGMVEELPLEGMGPRSPELLHRLVEAKKLAFADRERWVADPARADIPVDRLLDPAYLRRRAALITETASGDREPGIGGVVSGQGPADPDLDAGDTIYTMAVDRWGNAVSWIQSLFSSLGSGLVDPATGIVLQNRGAGFTLEAGHPNVIAPGKRPFHTLMPVLVTGPQGELVMTIGTPGGDSQSQSIIQTMLPILLHGATPQQAVEAPRFRSESGLRLLVEDRLDDRVLRALGYRGHDLDPVSGWTATFGSVQVIQRLPSGALRTGADMRREAAAAAY